MDIRTVRALIRQECRRLGGEAEFARVAGVSRQLINAVLTGKRPPRGKVLDAIDVELVETFRKKPAP